MAGSNILPALIDWYERQRAAGLPRDEVASLGYLAVEGGPSRIIPTTVFQHIFAFLERNVAMVPFGEERYVHSSDL